MGEKKEAAMLLKELLADGKPHAVNELKRKAAAAGVEWHELQASKRDAGVMAWCKVFNDDGTKNGSWMWYLKD